jgi:hypothetical protein
MIFGMTTPPPASPAQPPWWSPILYTAFGAFLGFVLTRFKDWLDDRQLQKRFLIAVRVELAKIDKHLKGTLKDATECIEKLDKGQREALYLTTMFQRGIYDSQIGKLKDVSNPLVIEIVEFYDKLSNLERVKAHFTSVSFYLTGLSDADVPHKQGPLEGQYRSALAEIIKRINELLPPLSSLIAKLERR